MRGLRPEEYATLVYAAGTVKESFDDGSPRHLAMLDLQEQGRVVPGASFTGRTAVGWHITPAGREALRLWPLMQALEAQP